MKRIREVVITALVLILLGYTYLKLKAWLVD